MWRTGGRFNVDNTTLTVSGTTTINGAGSILTRWPLTLRAVDSSGSGISGATITLKNQTGITFLTGTTNSTGHVTTTLTNSSYQLSTGTNLYYPFTLAASLAGYTSASGSINTLTAARTKTMTLYGGMVFPTMPSGAGSAMISQPIAKISTINVPAGGHTYNTLSAVTETGITDVTLNTDTGIKGRVVITIDSASQAEVSDAPGLVYKGSEVSVK